MWNLDLNLDLDLDLDSGSGSGSGSDFVVCSHAGSADFPRDFNALDDKSCIS